MLLQQQISFCCSLSCHTQGVNLTLGSDWGRDVTVFLGLKPIQLVNQSAVRAWILPPDDPSVNYTSLDNLLNGTLFSCLPNNESLDSSVNLTNTYFVQVGPRSFLINRLANHPFSEYKVFYMRIC